MISSMVAPASRFSNTMETGIRVSLNTHAPLTLPGMLSTAGHCDQSRFAMICAPFFQVIVTVDYTPGRGFFLSGWVARANPAPGEGQVEGLHPSRWQGRRPAGLAPPKKVLRP